MSTEPRESWPPPTDEGVVVQHVVLEIGALQGTDGEWKPSVSLELFTRDVEDGRRKRTTKVRLDAETAEAIGEMLPRAAQDSRDRLAERAERGEL